MHPTAFGSLSVAVAAMSAPFDFLDIATPRRIAKSFGFHCNIYSLE